MKSELTALTLPRISSGVPIWTSDERTNTLTIQIRLGHLKSHVRPNLSMEQAIEQLGPITSLAPGPTWY
jgi:hypothetical protein